MKVGTICYATQQGLGVLAKDFYDNGVITDVLVVEHEHRPTDRSWYPNAKYISMRPFDLRAAERFVKSMDRMVFFETPFHWGILSICRQAGVKTVLMPMYECMPSVLPYRPDVVITTSLLDQRYYPEGVFIPVPVPAWVEWKPRKTAKTFVHNAGHGGLLGRNGTGTLLDAMKYVTADVKMILRTQKSLQWGVDDPRVDVRVGTFDRGELYSEGEAFVFPERFNGLSLPLQEAFASGMFVIATDRFPMNTWLPADGLVTPSVVKKNRVSGRCHEFDESLVSPEDLALMIDHWAYCDVSGFSERGKEWASENSWENLKSRYLEVIRG